MKWPWAREVDPASGECQHFIHELERTDPHRSHPFLLLWWWRNAERRLDAGSPLPEVQSLREARRMNISPSIVLARKSDELRKARERMTRAVAEVNAAATDVQASTIAVIAALQDFEDDQHKGAA